MKRLDRVVLVQFFLFDAETLEVGGHSAFLGPNGTGKTAIADAIQIAMLGAHGNYVKLNAQRDDAGGRERTIHGYCLGAVDGRFKRENAQTYITLVFRDEESGTEDSCGVSLSAARVPEKHDVEGMFVLRGVGLKLEDHVERTKDGIVPLRWSDFSHTLKARARETKTEVVLSNRPEQYIGELLMAIGAGERINQRDFLKAFRKSILLRNIETVDGFVRDFLIDARAIDKARAMQQIEHFKKLSALVEQVRQHIEELGTLGKDFDKMHGHTRRAVAYETAAITLQHEALADRFEHLTEKAAELEEKLATGLIREKELKDEIDRLESELASIDSELAKSDEMQAKRSQEAVLEALRRESTTYQDSLLRPVLLAEKAADAVESDPQLAACRGSVKNIRAAVATARASLEKGNLDAAETAATSALQLVPDLVAPVERVVEAARADDERAQARLREAEAALKAAERFGVRLGPDAAEALQMLEDAGIKAIPVCTKIRVTDRKWQAAIEGFLGPNRDALMVPRGQENKAVDLLLARQKRLHNAYIVQPDHFERDIGRLPEADLVASLLEGDDKIALAFARQLFGAMRKAYTADDLRRNRQALTPDGGLSRSGSTRTIRLESAEAFKLGRKFDPAEIATLKREHDLATQAAVATRKTYEARVTIRDRVTAAQDTARLRSELQQAMGSLRISAASIERHAAIIAAIKVGKFGELEANAKQLRATLKERRKAQVEHAEARGSKTTEMQQVRALLATCNDDLAKIRERETAQRADPDYDAQQADECRQDLEKTKGMDLDVLVAEANRRSKVARSSFENLKDSTMDRFRVFIDRNNYGLIDERMDWRKAASWTHEERAKLEESELVQRQNEADQARQVAEESFRHDVANSIANAIHEMRAVMRDLNRTLDQCPEFTRSERYRFLAEIRPQYKMIYEYIMQAASTEAGDLFSNESEISKQIVGLLEQAASSTPGKDPNPLDDFRLMFSFDVEITVRGAHQAYLSSRVGPGSGGEHKTPFYVIAGAALSHAYRLDSKAGKRGAALMILDEAFNKMDPQNSYSAARFLDSLGLQLIMTAPDDSMGKLMPFCDRIFEMTRNGMDVFYEVAYVKDRARDLMRTDMVQEHPELLNKAIEEIRAQ